METFEDSKTPSHQSHVVYVTLTLDELLTGTFRQFIPDIAIKPLKESLGFREQIIFGASIRGKAVGIAFTSKHKDELIDCAQLLWLFVSPNFRKQGIGKALLMHIEKKAKDRGIKKLQMRMRYPLVDIKPPPEDLDRCLVAAGWNPFKPFMVIIQGKISAIANCSWLTRVKLFPNYSIFLWKDLPEKDREEILRKKKEKDWYPDLLSPFDYDKLRVDFNSLGLRRGDEVVGWIITHKVGHNLLNYSDCFISPEYQYTGIGVPLIVKSMQLQLAHPEIPLARVMVHPNNKPMVLFLEKKLKAYADIADIEFLADKDL